MSVHSRTMSSPFNASGMPDTQFGSFASQLKRAYRAGQHSRLQGLTREPPYDDFDLCLAWVCGFDATQREIDVWEETEAA
jgi:hypothetical protein